MISFRFYFHIINKSSEFKFAPDKIPNIQNKHNCNQVERFILVNTKRKLFLKRKKNGLRNGKDRKKRWQVLLFHFILFAHSYTSIRKARNYKNKRWRTNGKLWIECALEFLMKRFTNNLRSKAIFKQGNKLNFTIKWTNYIGNLLGCTWTIFSFLLFYYLLLWNSNAFFYLLGSLMSVRIIAACSNIPFPYR